MIIFYDDLKFSVICRFQSAPMGTCGTRSKRPNRRHWCGTGQEPSKGQVSEWEISKNSIMRKLGFFAYLREEEV